MTGSVTVMLPNDEQGRLDDEPEVAMLEGASVLFSHEETDEARVFLPHFVGRLIERDARAVHDGEVRGQRPVERDEAVVEDRDHVLR